MGIILSVLSVAVDGLVKHGFHACCVCLSGMAIRRLVCSFATRVVPLSVHFPQSYVGEADVVVFANLDTVLSLSVVPVPLGLGCSGER